MRKIYQLSVILLFAICPSAFAQSLVCNCPEGKPAAVFMLGGAKPIAVCGTREGVWFAEFCLVNCADGQPIGRWGADQRCQIHQKGQALLVDEYIDLPSGARFINRPFVWQHEQFYLRNEKIVHQSYLQRHLPHYSARQISMVLRDYQNLPDKNNDQTIQLAERLFVAAVSGSREAAAELIRFKEKFNSLDGRNGEEYDRVIRRFRQWRSVH